MRAPLITFAALLVVAGATYGAWMYYGNTTQVAYSDANPLYSVLMTQNASFADGERRLSANDAAGAERSFDTALLVADDDFQEGLIKLKKAAARRVTDPLSSIPLFKEVAVNPSYAYATRAYAVQYLGELYFNIFGDEADQMASLTFNSEPFAAFAAEGDYALAYRRLAEYGTTLQSLPILEMRIASWHADEIVRLRKSAQPDEAAIEPYRKAIDERFANAERELTWMSNEPSVHRFVPIALQIKASVLRTLAGFDLASAAEVEAAYKRAIDSFDADERRIGYDGYTRFTAAALLAETYGESRASDVAAVIAPLTTEGVYATSALGRYLSDREGMRADIRARARAIADIDASFKQFLMSLGWSESDFK